MNDTMNEQMHPRLNFWGCGSGLWGRPLVNESLAVLTPARAARRRRRAPRPAVPVMLPATPTFSRNGYVRTNFFGTGAWQDEEKVGMGALS